MPPERSAAVACDSERTQSGIERPSAASDTLKRMDARGVDPRDQTWEVDRPKYRVYFHDLDGTSYEYEVEGADVVEVLRWAETMRGDRSFVLYACVPQAGLGLLRLEGFDPNDPPRQ